MGITLKRKGSFKIINKNLKTIQKDFDSGRELEKIAAALNGSIAVKVLMRGIGVDDKKMDRYSRGYRNFKKRKGLEFNFRNLSLTGDMFSSLTTSRGFRKAKMFFGTAESAQKAIWNQNRQEFFGLGERERNIVRRLLRLMITKL